MTNSGYFPPAGTQNAALYPKVGPNYQKYGEQQGWVYSPRDDKYYRDQQYRDNLQKYEEDQGLRAKQPSKPGLGEAILPVAATLGAFQLTDVGGKALGAKVDSWMNPKAPTANPGATTQATAPQAGANAPAAQANPGLLGAGNAPATSTAPPPTPQLASVTQVTAVGSQPMPDGSAGTLMSDGAIVGSDGALVTADGQFVPAEQSPIIPGIQILGGAAQAYSGWKQYQDGQKLSGAANIGAGAFNAYAGATGTGASYVPWVGATVAAANTGQNIMNTEGNSDARAGASNAEAAKSAMLFVPGWGWIAYAAIAAVDAITGGKATQALVKIDNASNKITDKIDFGLGKKIRSTIFHQSTKGKQKELLGGLSQASDDPAYQTYLQGLYQGVQDGPADKEHPYGDTKGNKYKSWDEYKAAGLDAANLTAVYGNVKTYGPAWAKLTEDQRRAVTQANIDSDLYASNKGTVHILDEAKAKENFDNVMKGVQVGAKTVAQNPGLIGAAANPAAAPAPTQQNLPNNPGLLGAGTTGIQRAPASPVGANAAAQLDTKIPPRSQTSSPGFDKFGRRLPNAGLLGAR